jgi:hypothetical protein
VRGTVSFKYDPFGRRIEKVSPNATSIFAYDGDNLVETAGGTALKFHSRQNSLGRACVTPDSVQASHDTEGSAPLAALARVRASISLRTGITLANIPKIASLI